VTGARIAGWLMIPDPIITEAAAVAGFDWVGIDLQHGAWDLGLAFRGIQLLDALGATAIVRIGRHDLADIPRVCDHGARGVIVAMATGPELIAEAVSMARYPPDGSRSWAGERYGLKARPAGSAAEPPAIFAMIEDARGFSVVEEIVAVPGIAGLHVGPADLAIGLGIEAGPSGPIFDAALQRIVRAAHSAGIPVALHAVAGDSVEACMQAGFDEVVLRADIDLLRASFASELSRARGGAGQEPT
jgi:4-hydroxy-2-oxoheptanedioate aldolase